MPMGQSLAAEDLGDLALFAGLTADHRRELADLCTGVNLEGGEPLVNEGEATRDLFLLTDGSVRVSTGEGGQDRELAVLEPEAVLGELSLVLGEPRSATVAAIGPTALVRVDGEGFLARQAAADPAALQLAWQILAKLAARQAAMNREILALSQPAAGAGDEISRLREKLFAEWSF